ncbi:MAG: hypothetical protein ABW168_08920 [Sedimenticola sp.]
MEFSVHGVAEIRVEADSSILTGGRPVYWQTMLFLNEEGEVLGRAVLHLVAPAVALPIGHQPPYWGVDPSKPLSLVDGNPPF